MKPPTKRYSKWLRLLAAQANSKNKRSKAADDDLLKPAQQTKKGPKAAARGPAEARLGKTKQEAAARLDLRLATGTVCCLRFQVSRFQVLKLPGFRISKFPSSRVLPISQLSGFQVSEFEISKFSCFQVLGCSSFQVSKLEVSKFSGFQVSGFPRFKFSSFRV